MSNTRDFVIEKGKWGELRLVGYTGSEAEVTIPDGVEYIKNDAFKDCNTLKKLVIPEGVRGIEGNAFSGCTALESVVFPSKMLYIRGNAFSDCTALKEIVLPKLEMNLGPCFRGCTGLTKITINGCLRVDGNAFRNSESAEFIFAGGFIVDSTVSALTSELFFSGKLTFGESPSPLCDVLKKVLYPKHYEKPEMKREEALFAAKYILDGNGTAEYRAEWLKYIKGQKKHFVEKKKIFKDIQNLMLQENIVKPEDIGWVKEDNRPKRGISIEEAKRNFTIKKRGGGYEIDRFDDRVTTRLVTEPRIREVGEFRRGVADKVIDIPDIIGKTPVTRVAVGLIPEDAIVIASSGVYNKLSRSTRAATAAAYLVNPVSFTEDEGNAILAFVKKYPADVAERLADCDRAEAFVKFLDTAKPKAEILEKLIEQNPHTEIRALLMEHNGKTKKPAKKKLASDLDLILNEPKSMTITEAKRLWTYNKITWADTDEQFVVLSNYKGKDKHVVIPASVNRVPVKRVEGQFPAFVESVQFPNEDIEIKCHFRDCRAMADKNGFVFVSVGSRCILTDYVGDKNIAVLVIPEGITELSYGIFKGLNMREVILPEGMVSVAGSAFAECKNLQKVSLPESLHKIESSAFYRCNALNQLYIPVGVNKIADLNWDRIRDPSFVIYGQKGSEAQAYAEKYGNTFIEGRPEKILMPDFLVKDGVLTGYVGSGGNVVIPENVTEVASFAFNDNQTIDSVVIGGKVREIGSYAFANCSKLFFVKIGGNVKTIANCAFQFSQLKQVELEEGVESIGEHAFGYLAPTGATVKIPSSVCQIAEKAFYSNFGTTTIHAPAGSYAEQYAKENNIPFIAE